jgi:non-canonical poly(A) RNA polymerase PAPD5/7
VQVYSGGIGSYALLVMVAAFLQSHPSQRPLSARSRMASALDSSLGVLLLDFFRLYGRALYAEQVGVSCRHGQQSGFGRVRQGLSKGQ